MSLKDVSDWSTYFGPDRQILTDVQFAVQERVTNTDGTSQVLSGKIECHRLLLAAANPVFKDMFYGPSPVQGDTVVVEVIKRFLGMGVGYLFKAMSFL